MAEFEKLKGGKFKRKVRRKLGVFIDGVGLDRATKREGKIDFSRLMQGLCEGLVPGVARYYTIVPHEDDARQTSFHEAIERAGLEPHLKRLPPIGVKRQVSTDVQFATDLMTFATGKLFDGEKVVNLDEGDTPVSKVAVVVCPGRELRYAVRVAAELGVTTSLADFGEYAQSRDWAGVDRWIDLSSSETIWK